METLLDVISVKTCDDYTLELVFENGERRIFDMKPFFDKKPFVKLLNSPLFFKASVQYGTVVCQEISILHRDTLDRICAGIVVDPNTG